MAKLKGLCDQFYNLESIPIEKIARYLRRRENPRILKNELGNRILYPQAVPETHEGLMFDLAVLEEGLKLKPRKFYNPTFCKIYIPEIFLSRIPDLQKLVGAFIDAFKPVGITSILVKPENLPPRSFGTLIKPHLLANEGAVYLWVAGKKYQVEIGSLVSIPAGGKRVDLKFESTAATLLGKDSLSTEVSGGGIGVIVDTRRLDGTLH